MLPESWMEKKYNKLNPFDIEVNELNSWNDRFDDLLTNCLKTAHIESSRPRSDIEDIWITDVTNLSEEQEATQSLLIEFRNRSDCSIFRWGKDSKTLVAPKFDHSRFLRSIKRGDYVESIVLAIPKPKEEDNCEHALAVRMPGFAGTRDIQTGKALSYRLHVQEGMYVIDDWMQVKIRFQELNRDSVSLREGWKTNILKQIGANLSYDDQTQLFESERKFLSGLYSTAETILTGRTAISA